VLVQVDVVESSCLLPLEQPEAELLQLPQSLLSSDWDVAYNGIVSARRLCIHHPMLLSDSAVMPIVLASAQSSVQNLRSTVMRNAMLCIQEVFAHLPVSVVLPTLEETAKVLLLRAGSDKKFIADAALKVLATAAGTEAAEMLALASCGWVDNPNAGVVAAALQTSKLCLKTLEGRLSTSCLHKVLLMSSKGLKSKKAEGRDAAKDCSRMLRQAMGDEAFTAAARAALLREHDVTEIVQLSATAPAKANKKPALSIRERMLAHNKAKQQPAQQAGGFDICV